MMTFSKKNKNNITSFGYVYNKNSHNINNTIYSNSRNSYSTISD